MGVCIYINEFIYDITPSESKVYLAINIDIFSFNFFFSSFLTDVGELIGFANRGIRDENASGWVFGCEFCRT